MVVCVSMAKSWRLLEVTLKTKMHGRNVSTLYPNYTKLFYLPVYFNNFIHTFLSFQDGDVLHISYIGHT